MQVLSYHSGELVDWLQGLQYDSTQLSPLDVMLDIKSEASGRIVVESYPTPRSLVVWIAGNVMRAMDGDDRNTQHTDRQTDETGKRHPLSNSPHTQTPHTQTPPRGPSTSPGRYPSGHSPFISMDPGSSHSMISNATFQKLKKLSTLPIVGENVDFLSAALPYLAANSGTSGGEKGLDVTSVEEDEDEI